MATQTPPDLSYIGALIDGSDGKGWSERKVLGKRLRPFCVWHRAMLDAVKSPFLTNGDKTLRDVCIAVAICRTRFGQSNLRKPWLIPCLIWLKTLLWALLPHRKKEYGPEDPRSLNPMQRAILKHSNDFLEYCGDYLQRPKATIIPPESNGSSPRVPRGHAPEEIAHAADLMHWGIPETRAWEMPLGLANWYRIMAIKSTGADVDFMDSEEQQFTESLPPAYRWKHQNN